VPKISEDQREQRRQRFVDAAWQCAARRGYRAVTVDEICAEAGMSKGAFYTYFAGKREVLSALLDRDAALTTALAEEVAAAADPGIARAQRFVQAAVRRGEDAALVQLHADLWAEMLADPEVREQFVATVRARRAHLAEWIRDAIALDQLVDVPPNALAAVTIALTDGLMLHRALDPQGFRWNNVRLVLDALFAGVQADESARPAPPRQRGARRSPRRRTPPP